MPYLEHFAFKQWPFMLTPNRALFFPETHQPILDAVTYAIERGEPIVKVTGEVGTGKTLLCRLALQSVSERNGAVALITVPQPDHKATLLAVCREFGLTPGEREDAYQVLADHLIALHAAGRPAVLFVDEAQALDRVGLETIRLLSNLETDDAKLLQIVLFAQPEIDRIVRQYSMRQLTQRITFNFQTRPFNLESGMRYIRFRVEGSSQKPPPNDIFSTRAMKAIVRASDGIPRVINILADRALMVGFTRGKTMVGISEARRAVRDGTFAQEPERFRARSLFRFSGI